MAANDKTIRNVVIVVAVLLIVGLLLWLVIRAKQKKDDAAKAAALAAGANTTGSGTGGSSSSATDNFPLTLGSKGPKVSALQKEFNAVIDKLNATGMNDANLNKLVTDGVWGQKTQHVFTTLLGMLNISLTAITSQQQYDGIINTCRNYVGSAQALPAGWSYTDWLNYFYS